MKNNEYIESVCKICGKTWTFGLKSDWPGIDSPIRDTCVECLISQANKLASLPDSSQ